MDTVATDAVTLTIDGREVKVRKGISILQATREAGLYIPNLCNLPHMPPYAGCRMCVVEVEKMPGIQTSCTTMVAEGQVVTVDTEKLNAIRRNVMELIVIDHPWKCLTCYREPHCPPFVPCLRDAIVTDRCVQCPNNKRCELQDVTEFINTRGLERFAEEERSFYNWETVPIEAENPFIERDQNKCILCTRCTQSCNGIRYNGAIELGFRGPFAAIITEFDKPLHETVCEFCGDCAAVCPTSAFMDVTLKFKGREDVSVRSVCGHCGVGCGLRVDAKGTQIIGMFGDEANAVNGTEVCVRGRYDWGFIQSPLRIRKPRVRASRSPQARPQDVTWERAIEVVAGRLGEIKAANGPDAIAVLGSAKLTNEENYLIGKLARAVIGTNNVDHARSPYHRGTVEGLLGAFGIAGSTTSLDDLENAAAILVIGNDTHNETQVAALKIKQNVMRRGAQLIVAHPLETNLHQFAQLALRYRPGTEVALVNAIAGVGARLVHESVSGDAAARAEYLQSLADLTPERAEDITGVPAADLVRAAEMLTGLTLAQVAETGPDPEKPTRPACLVYGSGLSWHEAPVDLVKSIANLAILTGNVNRPKSGISVQLSDNNLQGATDLGVVADLLPGYRRLGPDGPHPPAPSPERRGRDANEGAARVSPLSIDGEGRGVRSSPGPRSPLESVWGAPIPTTRPRGFWEMIEAIEAGTIKALVCFNDQPLAAAAESDRVRAALRRLDFVVAVDFDSRNEITQFADVVLPGVTFAEKDGTYTNLERRVQRLRSAIAPAGEARPDWRIIRDLARALGGSAASWDYSHPSEIFDEIARVVPQYAGLDYDRLTANGIQWPCPSPDHPGTPRIEPVAVRFQPVDRTEPAAQSAGGGEFLLVTSRSIFTTVEPNTHSVYPVGRKLPDESFAWLHEDDAASLGVETGDPVQISSSLGEIVLPARAVDWQQPGVVYVPIDAAGSAVQRIIPHNGQTPPAEAWAVRVAKG